MDLGDVPLLLGFEVQGLGFLWDLQGARALGWTTKVSRICKDLGILG